MEKELGSMQDKVVWDTSDVYSLSDLLKHKGIKEAMFGRAFAILGVKGEELGADQQKWKARIVFPRFQHPHEDGDVCGGPVRGSIERTCKFRSKPSSTWKCSDEKVSSKFARC